jgi:nucleotide-binding universal stress UspA family protein
VILICYDGSPDAQAAIDRAGALFAGQQATILTVWEPFIDLMARSGAGFGTAGTLNIEELDAATEEAAQEQAQAGAERAQRGGLQARARTSALGLGTAETILSVASELDAAAVVLGTRGLTGLKSLLLGSVSHAVLQQADRPVTVVPSAELAAKRAAHRRAVAD